MPLLELIALDQPINERWKRGDCRHQRQYLGAVEAAYRLSIQLQQPTHECLRERRAVPCRYYSGFLIFQKRSTRLWEASLRNELTLEAFAFPGNAFRAYLATSKTG